MPKKLLRKIIFSREGYGFIEALLIIPLYIFLLMAIIESGFLVYDWAALNYATSSAAVKAAVQGQFSAAVRQEMADYISNWTSNGKEMGKNYMALSPQVQDNTVVVWGTDPNQTVQRGGNITVGAVYPIKFKLLQLGGLGSWLVQEYNLALRTQATVMSERYFE